MGGEAKRRSGRETRTSGWPGRRARTLDTTQVVHRDLLVLLVKVRVDDAPQHPRSENQVPAAWEKGRVVIIEPESETCQNDTASALKVPPRTRDQGLSYFIFF